MGHGELGQHDMSQDIDDKMPSTKDEHQVSDIAMKPVGATDTEIREDKEEHDKEQDDQDVESVKQYGVIQVEAITKVWSKKTLWLTFVALYLVSFFDTLTQATQGELVPYVTSSFYQHALLATTSVLSTIVGGVASLTIAKIINIWGRVEGFCFMLLLIVIGLTIKAACHNVESYAAAQTLYWVGHIGLNYIVTVFLADMTSLRRRMIMFGFFTTPLLGTTFAGPAIAEEFLKRSTWRWGFGTFCIVLPVVSVPVIISFVLNQRKAKRLNMIPTRSSGRTWVRSIEYYIREFDALGMILNTAGFALVLLPLSLASSSAKEWRSGHIIAMIVIGICCLIAFVIWEWRFAPTPYLPWKYLKNRTILASCVCYFTLFISIYCWDIYFSSYLQVVNQQSVKNAGYILNSYSLTSSVFAPLVGFIIERTGRFKWLGMTAIPFATLGTALLVYFRQPGSYVGYLVMCQIFNGVAGAIIPLCTQMAVMASVGHNEVSVVLALHGLFGSIGASTGLAISGAIWTNTLPDKLFQHLPPESKDQYLTIYASLPTQLSYAWDSPIRRAIVAAYGDTQRLMAIAGACFMPLLFVSILFWENLDVSKIAQTKGTVF